MSMVLTNTWVPNNQRSQVEKERVCSSTIFRCHNDKLEGVMCDIDNMSDQPTYLFGFFDDLRKYLVFWRLQQNRGMGIEKSIYDLSKKNGYNGNISTLSYAEVPTSLSKGILLPEQELVRTSYVFASDTKELKKVVEKDSEICTRMTCNPEQDEFFIYNPMRDYCFLILDVLKKNYPNIMERLPLTEEFNYTNLVSALMYQFMRGLTNPMSDDEMKNILPMDEYFQQQEKCLKRLKRN